MDVAEAPLHVFRWDLDKTYLDTDIDSVRGLLRAAVEPASHKRNVPGSAALLRALVDGTNDVRVCILSGSPEQMRPVIEEKLALDGVRFDQLILKDNLGNIRRGRLSAVRGQVGYKLPHLLEQRVGLGGAVGETLFGDDSEADAAIYALYADLVAGRVDRVELARVLDATKTHTDGTRRALDALDKVGNGDVVEDIFIKLQPRVPLKVFGMLGSSVTPVFSWFQAAVVLFERGRIDADGLTRVAEVCSPDPADLASWLADLVRRGVLEGDRALHLAKSVPPLATAAENLDLRLARMGPVRLAHIRTRADYIGFLRAVGAR